MISAAQESSNDPGRLEFLLQAIRFHVVDVPPVPVDRIKSLVRKGYLKLIDLYGFKRPPFLLFRTHLKRTRGGSWVRGLCRVRGPRLPEYATTKTPVTLPIAATLSSSSRATSIDTLVLPVQGFRCS